MPSFEQLDPFTGHSVFGLVAATNLNFNTAIGSGDFKKTIEELLEEAGIDKYTNDFFLGVAHWGLRERSILTFFREMNGQSSDWQNKALEAAFSGLSFYTREDDEWSGDNGWYPRNLRLDQKYRLEKTSAWQCAAALWTYANKEHPPTFSHVQKHDTEGIQYVFLGWTFLECMRWYPSLGDVILHQKVSERVRVALRSKEWRAAVYNRVAQIDAKNYDDELLGLAIKLLALNWPEIKAGSVNPVDLMNDVLDVDKDMQACGRIPKIFDEALKDSWTKGIEGFASHEKTKYEKFKDEFLPTDPKNWPIYEQKLKDETDTRGGDKFYASNLLTDNISNQSISKVLKLLF